MDEWNSLDFVSGSLSHESLLQHSCEHKESKHLYYISLYLFRQMSKRDVKFYLFDSYNFVVKHNNLPKGSCQLNRNRQLIDKFIM